MHAPEKTRRQPLHFFWIGQDRDAKQEKESERGTEIKERELNLGENEKRKGTRRDKTRQKEVGTLETVREGGKTDGARRLCVMFVRMCVHMCVRVCSFLCMCICVLCLCVRAHARSPARPCVCLSVLVVCCALARLGVRS